MAMFWQVSDFCDDNVSDPTTLHNADAPSLQNRYCDGKSVWQVGQWSNILIHFNSLTLDIMCVIIILLDWWNLIYLMTEVFVWYRYLIYFRCKALFFYETMSFGRVYKVSLTFYIQSPVSRFDCYITKPMHEYAASFSIISMFDILFRVSRHWNGDWEN